MLEEARIEYVDLNHDDVFATPNRLGFTDLSELYLPKSVPALIPTVQSSVDEHARQELADLAAYLAECMGLDDQPTVAAR